MNTEYAKIIADSISPAGRRITTLEVRYWRMIHGELMTHRMFARNAASSRAIPVSKTFEIVENDAFIPEFIGVEKKGMQVGDELEGVDRQEVLKIIDSMLFYNLQACKRLAELSVHKSIINRYLEPWSYITVLITATDFANFFALRVHEAAEKHFQKIAKMMQTAMAESKPVPRIYHIPYWNDDLVGLSIYDLKRVCTGRCARLSYLTQDGKRDWKKDIELHDRLMLHSPKHSSCAEHPATAMIDPNMRYGCYLGWQSYRHEVVGESVKEPVL